MSASSTRKSGLTDLFKETLVFTKRIQLYLSAVELALSAISDCNLQRVVHGTLS